MTPRDWIRSRAKEMRAAMTPHEKAMWRLLHEGELVALNWIRQAPFGDYILDFVSHSARLVVEVDGSQHGMVENVANDARRTDWLRSEGYAVIRFWNQEAIKARDDAWRTIYAAAASTPASARMQSWRVDHLAQVGNANSHPTSSSMEEVAARSAAGGGVCAMRQESPLEAKPQSVRVSPRQSSLRDDSSSIEEEQK